MSPLPPVVNVTPAARGRERLNVAGPSQSAQRSDAHHGPPYWFPRYLGGRSKPPGPRDRTLSAYLRFPFFDFPLLNSDYRLTECGALN